MLTEAELRESPLFTGIDYDSYLAMYTCFQAVSRSYRPDDVIYDFSSSQKVVGILERGEAALIRIDADGVETMMEQFRVGGVFGKTLDFSASRSVIRNSISSLFI